jgi:hypothetical protein
VSESIAPLADPQDLRKEPEHELGGEREASIVVTEPAVVALPRTRITRRVMAALHAMFPSSSGRSRPARRRYPPRFYAFLEDAATERGMQTRPWLQTHSSS